MEILLVISKETALGLLQLPLLGTSLQVFFLNF